MWLDAHGHFRLVKIHSGWGVQPIVMGLGIGGVLSAMAHAVQSAIVAGAAFLVVASMLGVSRLSITATRDGACVVRLGVVSTIAFRWADVTTRRRTTGGARPSTHGRAATIASRTGVPRLQQTSDASRL